MEWLKVNKKACLDLLRYYHLKNCLKINSVLKDFESSPFSKVMY